MTTTQTTGRQLAFLPLTADEDGDQLDLLEAVAEATAATPATARRTFYLRRAVHVAVAGAENSLCGVRLIGAIDTTADATCPNCARHTFETVPGVWAKVAPIGDGELGPIGGLPESTAGF